MRVVRAGSAGFTSRHRVKKAAWAVAAGLALLAAGPAAAKQPRSKAQVAAFKRAAPCPANGERRGPCPGWIVDHIMPLCAGGPDRPNNMQWQTAQAAKLKDREEVRHCRALKK